MKKQIKRSTTLGLKECAGELFEAHDLKFYFVKDEGYYFMIEQETGCGIRSLDADFYSEDEAWELLIGMVRQRTKKEFLKAIENAKKRFSEQFNIKFPVNE